MAGNESAQAKLIQQAFPNARFQFPYPPDGDDWHVAQDAADLALQHGGVLKPAPIPGVPEGQVAPQPQLPNLDGQYQQIALGNAMGAMKPVATLGNPNPQALGMDPLSAYKATMAQQQVGRAQQDLGTQQKSTEDYNKYALLRADITKNYADQAAARDAQVRDDWMKMQDETRRRGQDKQLEGVKERSRMMGRMLGMRLDQHEKNKLFDWSDTGQAMNSLDMLDSSIDEAIAYVKAHPRPLVNAIAGVNQGAMNKVAPLALDNQEWLDNVERKIEQQTDAISRFSNFARITGWQAKLAKEVDLPHYGLHDNTVISRLERLKHKNATARGTIEGIMEHSIAAGNKHTGPGVKKPDDKPKDEKKVDEFGDPL